MNISSMIAREVAKAVRKVGNNVRRGTLGTAVSDKYSSQITGNKYSTEENFEAVEYWQQFGLASRPPQGGEAMLVSPSGSGEGAVAIATTDRAHRPTVASGDTILYALLAGSDQATIHLKASGDIEIIIPESFEITVDDEVTIEAVNDISIESLSGEVEIQAGDIFIGTAGDTIIGATATAEPTFKGLLFNTAINLMLTPLSLALTATANAIGTSAGAGSGLSGWMVGFAVDPSMMIPPAYVLPSVSQVNTAPLIVLCDLAYTALNLAAAGVTTFQGALTGLLTTQVKVN